jgi:hypothetical protein
MNKIIETDAALNQSEPLSCQVLSAAQLDRLVSESVAIIHEQIANEREQEIAAEAHEETCRKAPLVRRMSGALRARSSVFFLLFEPSFRRVCFAKLEVEPGVLARLIKQCSLQRPGRFSRAWAAFRNALLACATLMRGLLYRLVTRPPGLHSRSEGGQISLRTFLL